MHQRHRHAGWIDFNAWHWTDFDFASLNKIESIHEPEKIQWLFTAIGVRISQDFNGKGGEKLNEEDVNDDDGDEDDDVIFVGSVHQQNFLLLFDQ